MMSHPLRLVVRVLLLSTLVAAPALALGPVDGEVGALWWANEYDTERASADAGVPGLNAELWWQSKFGLRAQMLGDVDDTSNSSDYTAVDVMWKAFSPTENNFVAVGLGWQDMDFTAGDITAPSPAGGDTSGMRIAVEGRVGIVGMVYAYGQAAYLPSMDDSSNSLSLTPETYDDMDGLEYEVGVSWKPAPFISVRGGFRENQLDYTRVNGLVSNDESSESSGFLLGVGFHF
jgi:hypothetical protein